MQLDDLSWSHFSPIFGVNISDMEFTDFGSHENFAFARTIDKKTYFVWWPAQGRTWHKMDPIEAQCLLHEAFGVCCCC